MSAPSALRELTQAAGAVFTDPANDSIPSHFADPSAEYIAATQVAAIFDYSHAGKIELTGSDAPGFVHNISTNDIKSLPLGGGCETYFCDARAKALFVAWVYHIRLADKRNALWLETTPGRELALVKYLDRYLIAEAVEIANVTHEFAQMHLAGPQAKAILESALDDTIPDLPEFAHMERTFGSNATCSIRRRDPLGLPGYDIVCTRERAPGVWRMLTAAGAKPAGLQTYETLRIEAGTPVYGIDIDETRFVMEVGNAARAVSYSKGCFPGQEPIVMARDRAGRVNRSFLRLKSDPTTSIPAGSKLVKDGQEVGVVTSSTISPRWQNCISLGYVHWKQIEPGNVLVAETPAWNQSVTVLASTDQANPS